MLKEDLNIEENDDPNADGKDDGEKPKVCLPLKFRQSLELYLFKIWMINLKRRKNRRDALLNKKNRVDPNAPLANRVPLPEAYLKKYFFLFDQVMI